MTLLIRTTTGSIEVALRRWGPDYTVEVSDHEGSLHKRRFTLGDRPDDLACAEALTWYDNCVACVEQYLDRPTSQSIAALINTLN